MQVNASNNKINKRKKYDKEKFSQPQDEDTTTTTTSQDNFFLLELRAAHGTFNLKHKDLYQLNCSSSSNGCFYGYKPKMHSLFNLKSNYALINLFHSKEESMKKKKRKMNEKNKSPITTTSTSFFQFPVSMCSNLGYSKKKFD